ETLTLNPLERTFSDIPLSLPSEIYGASRNNSRGLDMGNIAALHDMKERLAPYRSGYWKAYPIINGKASNGEYHPIHSPAHYRAPIGEVVHAAPEHCEQAIRLGLQSQHAWDKTEAGYRAAILERAADLLDTHRDEAIALCIREAGKTLKNAISEVREAIDF